MQPPSPKPVSQVLFGATLILLITLAVILIFQQLSQRPPGKSRVGWPPPSSAKPWTSPPMKTFLSSLRILAVLTLFTGALYPLAVWGVGQLAFRHRAEGSLLARHGVIVGSELLAQKTTDPRYFSPRPSAGDYATVASGASNLAWTSAKLIATIAENEKQFRLANTLPAGPVPSDALTTSGSGLDPDLTPAAVRLQAARVAAARHLTPAQRDALDGLIARHMEGGQLTPERLNILRLNLALDAAFPSQ